MERKLISQGAEAKIYLDESSSDTGEKRIIKERIAKNYRVTELDESIRKFRTKREVKIIGRLNENNVNVPRVIYSDKYDIGMQFIEGEKLRDYLTCENYILVAEKLAKQISLMHDNNVVHGDLTTSNMIINFNKSKDGDIFLIDFGLSSVSFRVEDFAVDLRLFKQAIISKHYNIAEKFILEFFKSYNPKEKKEIIKKLTSVESRGRNKNK